MSDWRRCLWKAGRLISSPLADLLQVGGRDDSYPPWLPLESPASGPATITGTMAVTDSADTAAFAGDHGQDGELAATDGADTAAFVGDVAHVGTLAVTDSADTAAFVGDLSHVGTMAATDSADASAFAGAIAHVGSLAATDVEDGFAADGTVSSGATTITGDMAVSDDSDVFAAVGNMLVSVGDDVSYSGYYEDEERKKKNRVSPAYAKALIEARLASLLPEKKAPSKRKKAEEHAPVAIDSIAKQSAEFAKAEREALVEQAVAEVVTMQSGLDAEIKAEFAALAIAQQLIVFEEEAIFMFMMAAEA